MENYYYLFEYNVNGILNKDYIEKYAWQENNFLLLCTCVGIISVEKFIYIIISRRFTSEKIACAHIQLHVIDLKHY